MKKNYTRRAPTWEFSRFGGWRWVEWGIGRYELKWSAYFRYPKTFNEIRQNETAKLDGHRVRRKRGKRGLPTAYDDKNYSRQWGRSWKDYTKHRKQYMRNIN